MKRLVLFALCSVISLMLAPASSPADPVMAQSQQASSTNSDSSTSPPAEPAEAAASDSGASTPPAQPSTPASSAPESDGSPNRPSSRPEARSLGLANPQASPAGTAPVAPDTTVPAKRAGGFTGSADKANSGKKTSPGGFTGASSSVSNPEATGGDPAPGRASAPAGAQELKGDFGPSLPTGTPHLYVNGAFGAVHISPDAPLEFSWDVRSEPDADGMILFITQSAMNPCDGELNPPSGITGTRAHEGQQGTAALSPSPLTLGSDYFLVGCPVRLQGDNFVFLGEATNQIEAHYAWAPDLIVSNIFLQSDEVRFQVKNIGVAEKKPGEIRYVLKQASLDHNGAVISERNFFGIAAITSLSRLRTNEETAEDRVTGQNITFSSNMRLTLCINIGHNPIERDFTNNCMTSNPSGLLPDLQIVGGRIILTPPPPKDDDPWYEDVGEFIVDLFDGVEFDESGIPPGDWAEVSVKNNGSMRIAYFEMIGGVWKNGESPVTSGRNIQETIEPGETKLIKLYFPTDHSRWDDEACCTGVAQIDPNNTLMESNEDNNKLYLEVQRIAGTRDHRN